MNILLTNDDGYTSVGLHCLAKHLAKMHKVTIVAPEKEMSCSSHSVKFLSGVTYKMLGEKGGVRCFCVGGTPADCVLFSFAYLLKNEKIDLVVSGVNNCLNVGSDYIYSGTVGAAQEATYLKHKGIALSLDSKNTDDYEDTCRFFADNIEKLASFATDEITLNINVPYPKSKDIKGIKVAPIGLRPYSEEFISQIAADGSEIFFSVGYPLSQKDSADDIDGAHVDNGYITITPIRLLGNCPETLEKLRKVEFTL